MEIPEDAYGLQVANLSKLQERGKIYADHSANLISSLKLTFYFALFIRLSC